MTTEQDEEEEIREHLAARSRGFTNGLHCDTDQFQFGPITDELETLNLEP